MHLFLELLYLGSRFWTSISNEGPDKTHYRQCASELNMQFPAELKELSHWTQPVAKFTQLQRCLAYKISNPLFDNATGFQHESCTAARLTYVCEVIFVQRYSVYCVTETMILYSLVANTPLARKRVQKT
jgi:hypothetical protein